jgi:hypothetical protein
MMRSAIARSGRTSAGDETKIRYTRLVMRYFPRAQLLVFHLLVPCNEDPGRLQSGMI